MTTTISRPGLETSLLESAYAAVADGVAKGALASGVLAVATSEEVVRLEAFGPVATDSIFLIASITKPIFATSVMRLVERGHVLLNEPVARHVPEFGANGKQDVRLWHMLTHTSGLDETWFAQASGPQRWEWPSVVARACAAPLQFPPGSRYSYCNARSINRAPLTSRLWPRRRNRDLPVGRARIRPGLCVSDQSLEPGGHDAQARAERHDRRGQHLLKSPAG